MTLKFAVALLVAFAALPSLASAANDPDLTYPTGTLLATGTKIRAHNVGDIKLTAAEGTYKCSYAEWTGTLAKNNGTEVEANIETGAFVGTGGEDKCTTSGAPLGNFRLTASSSNSMPWCLRSTAAMKEDEAEVRGGTCGGEAKPLKLTIDIKVPAIYCLYETASLVKGTYTTHPEDLQLTTSSTVSLVEGSPVTCPSSFKSNMTMTVENDKEAGAPTYISTGPKLTFPTGTLLASGSTLKATNVGNITYTDTAGTSNLFNCSSGQWTGTVRRNSGTEVEADIETASLSGTGSSGTCTYPYGNIRWTFTPFANGLPWCVRATSAMASDEFQMRGGKCSEASRPMRVLWESVTEAETECVYERSSTSPIPASYTTHPEDASVAISEAEFSRASGSTACPGSLKLDSTFTFERDNTPEAAPLYIS